MADRAADEGAAGIVDTRAVASSRGPAGRVSLLLVALPPLLLVAVLGAALAGSPAPGKAAIASAASASPDGRPADQVARVDFPTRAEGLQVVDVETAHARVGGALGVVLAVRGYLTLSPRSAGCGAAGRDNGSWGAIAARQARVSSVAAVCQRRGTLRSPAAADRRGVIHRLDVAMTLGADLPDAVTATHGPPLPVVLVGVMTGAADGCGNIDRCDQRFDANRVVWVDGAWRAPWGAGTSGARPGS
ncbi:MAG: hypothetical protein ACJ76W_10170 [Chloroflexota bacterium]